MRPGDCSRLWAGNGYLTGTSTLPTVARQVEDSYALQWASADCSRSWAGIEDQPGTPPVPIVARGLAQRLPTMFEATAGAPSSFDVGPACSLGMGEVPIFL